MDKAVLRKEAKAKIRNICREDESREIVRQILSMPEYASNTTILAYVPLSDEPDISPLLDDERVLLPYIENGKMAFSASRSLHRSALGFWEPGKREEAYDTALMLVPLLGYNSRLFRLGRGGGYYDRYIEENRYRLITAGVAFSASYMPEFIEEAHDAELDIIITPSGRMTVTSAF